MVQILVFLAICLGVGWLGRNRRLGFAGTFLASVILTPFVGLLALLVGEKAEPTERTTSDRGGD